MAPPSFLLQLRGDILLQLQLEVELTLKVAVMSAAGMSRTQIATALEVKDIEVRMAMVRLERVADRWQATA